jgi:ABC-2 type transport system permease protein
VYIKIQKDIRKMILSGFLKKELIQTLRDPRLGVMVLIAPIMQLLLFGVALTNDVINIRLGAYFAPNDVVAHDVYKSAIASTRFVPACNEIANTSPEHAIQSGMADAVIVAPKEGVTQSGARGGGELQLLINASNVLRAIAIEGYLQGILQQVCAHGIEGRLAGCSVNSAWNKSADGKSVAAAGVPGAPPSVQLVVRTLFNPTLETTAFTVPGVMATLLMMLVLLLTCTSIAKEKERGTLETIISAPIKLYHIILGKTVPFALVGLLNTSVILCAGMFFFDLPFRGNFVVFALENLLFVVGAVMLGILLSTFVQNQQQSMLCCFIVMFVMIMLSGSFFPVENMPFAMKCVAYMNPVAHHTLLVRNILLKGGDAMYVMQHAAAIVAAELVIAACAFKRFKITLN